MSLPENSRVYPAACPYVDLVRPMLGLHRVAVEALPPIAEPLAGVITAEGATTVQFQLTHNRVSCVNKTVGIRGHVQMTSVKFL